MPWRKGHNAGEHRLRRGNVFEREEVIQRFEIDPSFDGRVLEQSLDFRTEHETSALVPVVQRLDAESITGNEEPPAPNVPHGERKHAAQLVNAFVAELFIQM